MPGTLRLLRVPIAPIARTNGWGSSGLQPVVSFVMYDLRAGDFFVRTQAGRGLDATGPSAHFVWKETTTNTPSFGSSMR
jgi:hypothetical protein